MKEQEILNWLVSQQGRLDFIIAKAAKEYHDDRKGRVNFAYDLSACQFESYNLIRKKDLCYDRPNTAFTYSIWYHARRVNTFLTYFARSILNTPDKIIDIFDLGAGTGAVQWAIGLIYQKLKESGLEVPRIRLINIDSSPFMLYYNRDYLWKHFLLEYPYCAELNKGIEYQVNSWSNNVPNSIINPWIIASYLFDISDTENEQLGLDYHESVKNGFINLVQTFEPSKILLLTSDQPEKRKLLIDLSDEFSKNSYNHEHVSAKNLLLKGDLTETSKFRRELYSLYSKVMLTDEAKALNNSATWSDSSFVGTVLSRRQTEIQFQESIKNLERNQITLYNKAITVRREVILNPEQEKAAEHNERPTIITGPAGCGKSVVITERIKNLCIAYNYDPSLNILVSTFNKPLMSCLGNWIWDLLDKNKVTRRGNLFTFKNSDQPNITLLHFDVLPTQLGIGLNNLSIGHKEYHCGIIENCISEIKRERSITINRYDNVLNADYILDEYQRIIYGYQIIKKEDYLNAERKGRPRLSTGGIRRQLLWEVIVDKYLKKIKQESFITKRHRFLQQLRRKEISVKYSHIFVDEFQDCTFADYEIFYSLLIDPNNLVIGGDIAQAIQIGAVADIPRADAELMSRRSIFRLKGSYRLPFRISECIRPVSILKENANIVTPFKGSPPGARPIVVYAVNFEDLQNKLCSIYHEYSVFDLDGITILETDWSLRNSIRNKKISCETATILRLKGLEKTCVLWNTEKDIAYKEEVSEFIYTILSRTSSVLIIMLTENTLPKYYRIIDLLRKDRLILWDEETKINFNRFCKSSISVEDETDEE